MWKVGLVGAAVLVAASGCGPRESTPAQSASGAPANSTEGGSAAKQQGDGRLLFQPDSKTLSLALGEFGPCELEHDRETKVSVVYCEKAGSRGQEGILFNFYLPGVWNTEPFDAESVAMQLRDGNGPTSFVEGAFAAPDAPGGPPAFHIIVTSVHADTPAGQVSVVKVVQLGGAVYSMIYSRLFDGPVETMPQQTRAWLAENLKTYSSELARVQVDEQWIPHLKKGL